MYTFIGIEILVEDGVNMFFFAPQVKPILPKIVGIRQSILFEPSTLKETNQYKINNFIDVGKIFWVTKCALRCFFELFGMYAISRVVTKFFLKREQILSFCCLKR